MKVNEICFLVSRMMGDVEGRNGETVADRWRLLARNFEFSVEFMPKHSRLGIQCSVVRFHGMNARFVEIGCSKQNAGIDALF